MFLTWKGYSHVSVHIEVGDRRRARGRMGDVVDRREVGDRRGVENRNCGLDDALGK